MSTSLKVVLTLAVTACEMQKWWAADVYLRRALAVANTDKNSRAKYHVLRALSMVRGRKVRSCNL